MGGWHLRDKGSDRLLVAIGFVVFIVIGFNGGMMGVAWPSIRDTFGVGDDAFAVLTMVSMLGSLAVTFYSGSLIDRFGIGPSLMVSCVAGALGYVGYALAPSWAMIVLLGLATAIGIATINPGINAYFAMRESAGRMNWLHACFGLGATLGPLAMTVILGQGFSWRWGYGLVVLSYVLVALLFGFTLKRWPGPKAPVNTDADTEQVVAPAAGTDTDVETTSSAPSRMWAEPAIWVSLLLFFAFTGMEVSTGQWSYTLFTEGRGIEAAIAGTWASAYWMSMTAGRAFFGLVADRIKPVLLVRFCMLGAVLGAALIWTALVPVLGLIGLMLTGFCLAPLFPVITFDSSRRLGAERAARVIGYQGTAVKLGLAAIPALAGVMVEGMGAQVIGPFLVVLSVVAMFLHEASLQVKLQG